jgi:hypothetical protein
MSNNNKGQPLLLFKFSGDSIHDGNILYDDLSTFISNISLAIERIIKSIQTGESVRRGRPFKSTQLLSALEIVSMRKGSFSLGLDLRRNGQHFPMWDLGEQAVDILLQGFSSIEKDSPLPRECDQNVLIALREAGRIIDRGIDNVYIRSKSSFGIKKTHYTQPVRERIITHIRRFEQSYTIVEGRLLSIDAKEDKLRCRIEPSIGEPILCKFDESLTEQVIKSIRQFVQARGEAYYEPTTNKISLLNIKDLESIEESSAIGSTTTPLSSFWKSKTFEELANEQNIYPLDDISKLTGGWPDDEDVNLFLESIRSSRKN